MSYGFPKKVLPGELIMGANCQCGNGSKAEDRKKKPTPGLFLNEKEHKVSYIINYM